MKVHFLNVENCVTGKTNKIGPFAKKKLIRKYVKNLRVKPLDSSIETRRVITHVD